MGPYVACDGLICIFLCEQHLDGGRTDTVNGACPTLYVEYYLSGRDYYGRCSYSGAKVFDAAFLRDVCAYR
jgi:hypothetical protein